MRTSVVLLSSGSSGSGTLPGQMSLTLSGPSVGRVSGSSWSLETLSSPHSPLLVRSVITRQYLLLMSPLTLLPAGRYRHPGEGRQPEGHADL